MTIPEKKINLYLTRGRGSNKIDLNKLTGLSSLELKEKVSTDYAPLLDMLETQLNFNPRFTSFSSKALRKRELLVRDIFNIRRILSEEAAKEAVHTKSVDALV